MYVCIDKYLHDFVSGIKTTLIYPATQKHISKYRSQEMFILQETAEDYENITTPFIDEEQFSIQVCNLLYITSQ